MCLCVQTRAWVSWWRAGVCTYECVFVLSINQSQAGKKKLGLWVQIASRLTGNCTQLWSVDVGLNLIGLFRLKGNSKCCTGAAHGDRLFWGRHAESKDSAAKLQATFYPVPLRSSQAFSQTSWHPVTSTESLEGLQMYNLKIIMPENLQKRFGKKLNLCVFFFFWTQSKNRWHTVNWGRQSTFKRQLKSRLDILRKLRQCEQQTEVWGACPPHCPRW